MPLIGKLFLAVMLLAVAGFCGFGFLATFESPSFIVWRLAYAGIGLASVLGASWLIYCSRGGSPRGFPIQTRNPDDKK